MWHALRWAGAVEAFMERIITGSIALETWSGRVMSPERVAALRVYFEEQRNFLNARGQDWPLWLGLDHEWKVSGIDLSNKGTVRPVAGLCGSPEWRL
jgi:hypothetical protein